MLSGMGIKPDSNGAASPDESPSSPDTVSQMSDWQHNTKPVILDVNHLRMKFESNQGSPAAESSSPIDPNVLNRTPIAAAATVHLDVCVVCGDRASGELVTNNSSAYVSP
jgi:hypothetical protein